MKLRCVTFNVLADAYLGYGKYSRVDHDLLKQGARLPYLLQLITGLSADVICLQEVEQPLLKALCAMGKWQVRWSKKAGQEPDGCLTLVRRGLTISDFTTYAYSDGSNHIMQSIVVKDVVFANTHIQWDPPHKKHHAGVNQAKEMLKWLKAKQQVVILADCNDRLNGRVRLLIKEAGFTNVCGNGPTALINKKPAPLDIIAVRGINAKCIKSTFVQEIDKGIPNVKCPSDHVPVMACIETD